MLYGFVLGSWMWLGVIASLGKWLGYFPEVPWVTATYPLWGTVLLVFLVECCEQYLPADDDNDLRRFW